MPAPTLTTRHVVPPASTPRCSATACFPTRVGTTVDDVAPPDRVVDGRRRHGRDSAQAADFSKMCTPQAEPRPMTWARPTLAPSI